MDDYKVKQLRQMLSHETGSGEHYGARLSHRRGRAESPYPLLRDTQHELGGNRR